MIFSETNGMHFMGKQMFCFVLFRLMNEKFYELFGFSALEQDSAILLYLSFDSMFSQIRNHIFGSEVME
jgi:hypothetical protein